MIVSEFESAVADGYIRFLAALTNEDDVAVAEILLNSRNNFENTEVKIEAVIDKEFFLTDKDSKGNNGDYIKNCMVNFDGIIVYHEENRGAKFYSINHYLLYWSTRVILLYDNTSEAAKEQIAEKEIDDFFIANMLYKDVKKLILRGD